ncbi:HAMP domain-containing sensor histidine kinase [Anoxynatronum sibiricum]|uniref:HAMP domain-containing sensor histidine kinase n=1 Tax=Anoxynatronum sibiricum TaxID=210623 RepID=A0ABU9VX90_9CLOT
MLKGMYSGEKAQRSFEFIDNAINRASGIIDNLLGFSRISNDSIENVHLQHFLEEVVALFQKSLQQRKIHLTLNAVHDSMCLINAASLKHILVNLIANAVDAIDETGAITLSASADHHLLSISIEDDGCRIPEHEIKRIFNPFYTTKEPGKGTQFNLSIPLEKGGPPHDNSL